MGQCGCKTNISCGKKYVCSEHLDFVLSADKKPETYDTFGQEVSIKQFKELVDFDKQFNKKLYNNK